MSPDCFILRNGVITAEVTRRGAELRSLTDATGTNYLWGGQLPWQSVCPLLFPVVGLPRRSTITCDGHEYPMGRHGFAHQSDFELVVREPDSLQLRLLHCESTRAIFPFAFELMVSYRLRGAGIEMTFHVSNVENDRSMPFNFGVHPGFRWPLPGEGVIEDNNVELLRPRPVTERRLNVEALLSAAGVARGALRSIQLTRDLFASGSIILENADPAAVLYRGSGDTQIKIESKGFNHLALWSTGLGEFICIEPWLALPQHELWFGDFAVQPGIALLAAHDTSTFSLSLSVTHEVAMERTMRSLS